MRGLKIHVYSFYNVRKHFLILFTVISECNNKMHAPMQLFCDFIFVFLETMQF